MRAIVVREAGDSSVLKLEELPASSPGPGEVTIDVAFADRTAPPKTVLDVPA